MASRGDHLCEGCGNPAPLELPFCGSCGHANDPEMAGSAAPSPAPPRWQGPNGQALDHSADIALGMTGGPAGRELTRTPATPTAAAVGYDPPRAAPGLPAQPATAVAPPPPLPPTVAPLATHFPAGSAPGQASRPNRSRMAMLLAVVLAVLVAAVVSIALVSGGSDKGAKGATTTTVASAPAGSPAPSTASPPTVVAGTSSDPWAAQTLPSNTANYLYDISCSTTTTCWAVGKTGSCPQGVMCNSGGRAVIVATDDGGQTWEPQQYPTDSPLFSDGYLFSVSCGAPTACVAGGSGSQMVLLSTHDGGSTWVSDSYPSELSEGHIFGVFCKTASNCWAVGGASNTPFILATTDGGQSWKEQHVPSALGVSPNGLLTMGCTTTSNCVMAANAGGSLLILVTKDGGSNWSAQPYPASISAKSNDIGFVSCPTQSSCYISGSTTSIAGGAPVVLATHDGGAAWESVRFPSSLGLTAINWIRCAGGSHCWALASGASGPMILATTDGGSNWAAQPIPTNLGVSDKGLAGLTCPKVSACWVVGNNAADTNPVILAARG